MLLELARIDLPDEDATGRLAARLAAILCPGDVLLLSGPIGAGKTAFARALIRAAMSNPAEDVPSPTFTLVQTYPTPRGEIWHADLYRLSHPDEAVELGLGARQLHPQHMGGLLCVGGMQDQRSRPA